MDRIDAATKTPKPWNVDPSLPPPVKSAAFLFAILGLLASVTASAQFQVYENTKNVRTNVLYRFSREHGDEVFLGPGNRTLAQFRIQYFGDFNATTNTNAAVRLRIYRNDGPDGLPGAKVALMPKSVLFESAPIRLAPGYNLVTVDLPFVTVPDSFTWTAHFTGLSFLAGDSAGLVLADPPTVGAPLPDGKRGSFWDAWFRDDPTRVNGWRLDSFGFKPQDPKASFYAGALATPDATAWAIPETVTRPREGQARFSVKGRPGVPFEVYASTDLQTWERLGAYEGSDGLTDVLDVQAVGEHRFYRVDEVLHWIPRSSIRRLPDGKVGFRVETTVGRKFAVQVSENLRDWTDLAEVTATKPQYEFEDAAGMDVGRMFRVVAR